jgi:glutamate synthase (NADPH/NADH) large chain
VWHRGAVDADGKTGDGAGILIEAPQDFFREIVVRTGHTPRSDRIFVGQIFLPRLDLGAQERARVIVESEIIRAGFVLYGWRQVPVDISQIGEKANATRPEIEQVLLPRSARAPSGNGRSRSLHLPPPHRKARAGEQHSGALRLLAVGEDGDLQGHVPRPQIDSFYPDLKRRSLRFERGDLSPALFDQHVPAMALAQPFRMLAHNGEINTLKGNVNWMRSHEVRMASDAFGEADADVKPIIQPSGSDSAALDNVFEVLVRAGRSAPMAKTLLVPEAWAKSTTMKSRAQARSTPIATR